MYYILFITLNKAYCFPVINHYCFSIFTLIAGLERYSLEIITSPQLLSLILTLILVLTFLMQFLRTFHVHGTITRKIRLPSFCLPRPCHWFVLVSLCIFANISKTTVISLTIDILFYCVVLINISVRVCCWVSAVPVWGQTVPPGAQPSVFVSLLQFPRSETLNWNTGRPR